MKKAEAYNPFTSNANHELSIGQLGERKLLKEIRDWLGAIAPESPHGMGDDCAVLPGTTEGQQQLLTTDCVSYGQHFNAAVSPQDAGAKLIKRNLSDIAAMGGQPGPALLTLLCGWDLSILWLEQFFGGIRQSCEAYGVSIVGGDVSEIASGHFSAALTLTGQLTTPPILRSTAKLGDCIYVTGSLGGSIRAKHYQFEPRLKEGQWLASQSLCTAMMDVTDGLSKDLSALLPEECSAAIDLNTLPISEDAYLCEKADGRPAAEHAFCDGEDYELGLTASAEADLQKFESDWSTQFPDLKLSKIGHIIKKSPVGRYVDAASSQAIDWPSGYEHFKRA